VAGLGVPADGGAERSAARANCVIFSWVLMVGQVCGLVCVCVPKDMDTLPNFAEPDIPQSRGVPGTGGNAAGAPGKAG
jgi:hypothetical protein